MNSLVEEANRFDDFVSKDLFTRHTSVVATLKKPSAQIGKTSAVTSIFGVSTSLVVLLQQ